MKIEHLYYIKEIAKHQSISAAAKQLYIGQTTLSAIVRSLEEELGVHIFRRTPAGVTTTSDGERVILYADRLLEEYEELQATFRPRSSPEKIVHIIGNETANSSLSVYLTKQVHRLYRELSLIFLDVHRTKTIPCIREGLSNIGVTSYDDTEVGEALTLAHKNEICIEKIFEDKFYLCVSADSKYANRESVDISELQNENFVVPSYYSMINNGTYLSQIFRVFRRVATLTNNELVKRTVVNSDMVSILAGSNFIEDSYLLHGQLALVQLTGFEQPNVTDLYLMHKKEEYLDQHEKQILKEIQKFYQNAL